MAREEPEDPTLREFYAVAGRIRDENRPTLEFAAAAIEDALGRATERSGRPGLAIPVLTGPKNWSWQLPGGRMIILIPSQESDPLGHPTLVVREEICPPLETYVLSSSLVIGVTREQIVTSVLTSLLNHTAAVAGVSRAARVNVLDGDVLGEIERIRDGGSRDPERLTDAVDAMAAEVDRIVRKKPAGRP